MGPAWRKTKTQLFSLVWFMSKGKSIVDSIRLSTRTVACQLVAMEAFHPHVLVWQ